LPGQKIYYVGGPAVAGQACHLSFIGPEKLVFDKRGKYYRAGRLVCGEKNVSASAKEGGRDFATRGRGNWRTGRLTGEGTVRGISSYGPSEKRANLCRAGRGGKGDPLGGSPRLQPPGATSHVRGPRRRRPVGLCEKEGHLRRFPQGDRVEVQSQAEKDLEIKGAFTTRPATMGRDTTHGKGSLRNEKNGQSLARRGHLL